MLSHYGPASGISQRDADLRSLREVFPSYFVGCRLYVEGIFDEVMVQKFTVEFLRMARLRTRRIKTEYFKGQKILARTYNFF